MNCKTASTLASEALDQRLSQPDAIAFRTHILGCPSCHRHMDRLRRLSIATKALANTPVSADFRSTLIQRIEAGEGSPRAVLDGPVPLRERVKFFASGAATAAALLLSAWLVADGLSSAAPRNSAAPKSSAALETTAAATAPHQIDANTFDRLIRVSPVTFGQQAFEKSKELFMGLQREAPRLVSQPPKNAFRKLVDRSNDAIIGFRLLQSLNNIVILPERFSRSVERIESNLQQVLRFRRQPARSREVVQSMVRLILKDQLVSDESPRLLLAANDQELELVRRLPAQFREPENVRAVLDYLRRYMFEGDKTQFEPSPSADATVKFGGQTILLHIMGQRR